MDIEIVLAYDPRSLRLAGDPSYVLTAANGAPPPLIDLRFTALSDTGDEEDELTPERRIGVHYLHDGRLVGVAWRTVIAAPDEEARKRADPPAQREHELLDLSPLLADQPPDLTLAVFRADSRRDSGKYVWTAYPSADVIVPDVSRARDVGDPTGLANRIGSQVADLDDRPQHFAALTGIGRSIGQSVPPSIQRVIRQVVSDPARTQPASLLLLTEDPYVPWELAVLNGPQGSGVTLSGFGGSSPFLGAHAAIARWPLTDVKPRPRLVGSVVVETRAVVTAQYVNVAGWAQLRAAELEAEAFVRRFPLATVVRPYFADLRECLCGSRPADALHVALHGRFQHDNPQSGLVLLTHDLQGKIVSSLVTSDVVQGLRLMRPTFVFLNACQVGQADDLLGDYAGMAASFLAAGASGVVAALWNVEDAVAGRVAEQFYDLVSGPDAVSVAEALRRIRAAYIDDLTAEDRCSATRMAYQFFGHPNLKLTTA
jgi:CHAT domain